VARGVFFVFGGPRGGTGALSLGGETVNCEAGGESNPSPTLGEAHIEIPPVRIHHLDERRSFLAPASRPLICFFSRGAMASSMRFISFVENQPIAAVAA